MDDNRKYEYVMERPEIREFCRFAYWQQIKYRKGVWLTLLLISALEDFVFHEAAL